MSAADSRLTVCATIPLPGLEGRLDHFAIDPKGQRLFLSGLGNNSLEVLSLREGRRLQSIAGMKKPSGVAYLGRWNRICVANDEDGTLRFYDAANYQPKQIIRGLDQADNVRYDPVADRVYVGYGKGGIGIIDAAQGQVIGMIKLPAHPEAFQLDWTNHTLFVNLPGARQIALIDVNKREVMGAWSDERFSSVFPMALDAPNRRLLVASRKPARLLALDLSSGKTLSELAISGDADDLFLDAKRKRIYVSCGDGAVEVIEQIDPDHYRVLEKVPTAAGARTSFFSSELDLLAVGVPHRANQNAEIRLYQVR